MAVIFPITIVSVLLILIFSGFDPSEVSISPDGATFSEGSQTKTPIPPTAKINPNGGIYEVNEKIAFSAGESRDQDGRVVMYEWDFGDGGVSSDVSTLYSYATEGEFLVTLTVTDNDGEYSTDNASIFIEPIKQEVSANDPRPPIAKISSQNSVEVNQKISFSANNSIENDGNIIEYEWKFGDGTTDVGKTVEHTFDVSGNYNVLLVVTDTNDLSDAVSKTITVTEKPFPKTLPNPVLTLVDSEKYDVRGNTFTKFNLSVQNAHQYPEELFVPSPDLPPCGKNENSARTWVHIYSSETKNRLYGFCALSSPSGLDKLWFAIPVDNAPPQSVYIELEDRKEEKTYTSNSVEIR